MDQHTLELLEFAKVRELLAGRAATSLGKELARSLAPGTNLSAIARRSNLTSEMSDALSAGSTPPFAGLGDIRALARRAAVGGVLEAEELATAAETMGAIGELDRWLDRVGSRFPRLGGLRETIAEYSGVVAAIGGCLDRRGKVLDNASRKLSVIRSEIAKAAERIQEILQALLRSPEIRRCLRYPNFTMVGHHYVLPVAKDFRGAVEGAIQRTSASNETVYIEPKAIAEQSAQLAFLRAREDKEIRRILRWLNAQVGQVADDLVRDLLALAELDLVHAQARLAIEFRMTPVDFSDDGLLVLDSARHPLLEHIFKMEAAASESSDQPRRDVVPIDLRLGASYRLLVVTGPNTGGKTVALKTAALLSVMAQAGMHIPVRAGARMPVFDQILADIGDEQSLEQSLSTFSSHMRRVTAILGAATERSFVILDELGAGTDPAEGAALGRAILDELDSIGCLAIVTTHLGELKTYALNNTRARNAAVEFDLETLEPRYTLHLGDVGRSNALLIARRLNVPGHLVDRAASYLGQGRNPLGAGMGRTPEASS